MLYFGTKNKMGPDSDCSKLLKPNMLCYITKAVTWVIVDRLNLSQGITIVFTSTIKKFFSSNWDCNSSLFGSPIISSKERKNRNSLSGLLMWPLQAVFPYEYEGATPSVYLYNWETNGSYGPHSNKCWASTVLVLRPHIIQDKFT